MNWTKVEFPEIQTSVKPLVLKIVSPHEPAVLDLIRQLNEHNLSLCPPEACYLDPPEVLSKDNCTMIGVYDDSTLCGIGAVKLFDDYGEIKRMFVPESFRGKGISSLILGKLLGIIEANGIKRARLETSHQFTAAVSLYRKHGFKDCGRFGSYESNDYNLFMEKVI